MSIIYSKEQDGTLNVLVCGKVTRDAETKQNNHGTKVKFSVAYGKKKYMDCEAWMDSPAGTVAACLEAGDCVGVSGTHRTWEYNGKTYASIDADMIFTLPQISSEPLAQSPSESASSGFEELEDDDDGELPFE